MRESAAAGATTRSVSEMIWGPEIILADCLARDGAMGLLRRFFDATVRYDLALGGIGLTCPWLCTTWDG